MQRSTSSDKLSKWDIARPLALQLSTLMEGYVAMRDIPCGPIGCIRSAAMFYVVPLATNVKTMMYMGLRAILGCSTGRWTMMYKWGHPVATLPNDEGDCTSLSQNDVNSANHFCITTSTTCN
eukprot:6181060-Pleurochrysis_carterae.AAC.1